MSGISIVVFICFDNKTTTTTLLHTIIITPIRRIFHVKLLCDFVQTFSMKRSIYCNFLGGSFIIIVMVIDITSSDSPYE